MKNLPFDIYIIHNFKLHNRLERLKEKILDWDIVNLVQLELDDPLFAFKHYGGLNRVEWHKRTVGLYSSPPKVRALTNGEIFATGSHFFAYDEFLKNSTNCWIVVLEDDVILSSDFVSELTEVFKQIPEYADALFFGGGYPHDLVTKTIGQFQNFLIKDHPATNTVVGYAIKRSLISKICQQFNCFYLPIDLELSYLLKINDAVVLHLHPYIVSEGSKSVYNSSLRKNSFLYKFIKKIFCFLKIK